MFLLRNMTEGPYGMSTRPHELTELIKKIITTCSSLRNMRFQKGFAAYKDVSYTIQIL